MRSRAATLVRRPRAGSPGDDVTGPGLPTCDCWRGWPTPAQGARSQRCRRRAATSGRPGRWPTATTTEATQVPPGSRRNRTPCAPADPIAAGDSRRHGHPAHGRHRPAPRRPFRAHLADLHKRPNSDIRRHQPGVPTATRHPAGPPCCRGSRRPPSEQSHRATAPVIWWARHLPGRADPLPAATSLRGERLPTSFAQVADVPAPGDQGPGAGEHAHSGTLGERFRQGGTP